MNLKKGFDPNKKLTMTPNLMVKMLFKLMTGKPATESQRLEMLSQIREVLSQQV